MIVLTILAIGAALGATCTYVIVTDLMAWWVPISTVSLVLFALLWGGPKMLEEQERVMGEEFERRDL